jgi:acetolactate decarboxylase
LIKAPPDEAIPFWVATHFQAERQMSVTDIDSIEDLGARIDPFRPGANLFVAIKIKGVFEQVEMRTVSRVPEGVGLLEASSKQAMVCIEKVSGTLVGFWSPAHTNSLNIPGYHFHFLSDDYSSGGHVLDLKADSLEIGLDFQSNLRLALPETKQFLEADLSHDIGEQLHRAESKPQD